MALAPSKAPPAVPDAGLALVEDEDADRLADVEPGAEDLGVGVAAAEDEARKAGAGLLGADVRGGATERDLGGVSAVASASASAAAGARLAEAAGRSGATLARGSGRSIEGRESGGVRASANAREGGGGAGRGSATGSGGAG